MVWLDTERANSVIKQIKYIWPLREKKPIALHHKGINKKDKLIHFLNLKTKCNEQMAAVEHLKKRTLGMKKSMNQLYSEEEHKTV